MTGPTVAAPRETPPANPLAEFLLRLGDDRLVLGHRLSEWCGHAPILEEDIALANIALDLVGQASAFLAAAGEAEGQGRTDDTLAYFRDEREFRNALLVERPNGDFAVTILRQFLFDAWSVLLLDALKTCGYAPLAAIAAKALKEATYHLRHSSEWVLRLGDGTDESHARAQRALDDLWRFTGELFQTDAVDEAVAGMGIRVDYAALRSRWNDMVSDVVKRATLALPADQPAATGGRRGRHSEYLGHMLAEMQSVARAHPGATW
ncbi:MAG: phenylacetate-CoA oxygenase subunit PaaC [Gemmatimonadota bacterium]|nr:phenylacetate-CoA oxygenase subunit PaaC [Gemmatimonadota bacterium]